MLDLWVHGRCYLNMNLEPPLCVNTFYDWRPTSLRLTPRAKTSHRSPAPLKLLNRKLALRVQARQSSTPISHHLCPGTPCKSYYPSVVVSRRISEVAGQMQVGPARSCRTSTEWVPRYVL